MTSYVLLHCQGEKEKGRNFAISNGGFCKYYTVGLHVNLKEKKVAQMNAILREVMFSTNGQRTHYYLGTFSLFVIFF